MRNRILTLGILFLLVVSTVIPLTIGYSYKHYIAVNTLNNPPGWEWIKTFDRDENDIGYSVQQTMM